MNLIAVCGAVLLLASFAVLAWVVSRWWDLDAAAPSLRAGEKPSLEQQAREYLRQSRAAALKRAFLLGGGLLLVSTVLILLSQVSAPPTLPPVIVQVSGSVPPTAQPGPTVILPPQGIPPDVWYQPWFVIPFFAVGALFVAGILLVLSRSTRKQVAGAAMVAIATATSQFHLIKEFKFSPEFKLEGATEKWVRDIVDQQLEKMKDSILITLRKEIPSIVDASVKLKLDALKFEITNELKLELKKLVGEINVDVKLEAIFKRFLSTAGPLGPVHLGAFTDFELGNNEFTSSVVGSIDAVCEGYRTHGGNREALLLVVGATDRVPLGPSAKSRYESNVGLARARAEVIKTRIVKKCGAPEEQILAIVSGPLTTPKETAELPDRGRPKDRMVDVWALWGWRPPAPDSRP